MDPLLERAIAGDADAQQELVTDHSQVLRRYLDRRMGTRLRRAVSAADLSQEVFARVFRALSSLPADATQRTFRAWLFRNADWVLNSHGLRSRRHRGESAVGDPNEPQSPSPSVGPVTAQDEVRWLETLLARLKPSQAELVRRRMQGEPFAQIAERLDISEANARQQYGRIIRALREQRDATKDQDE